ncbi:PIN domain-containing protein [Neisseria sp. CCUG12390]|uniref:PIN domain-containing protein n=1 Tax=Neisseria sp. CCUG12390 TaxID=3392035 RepID=UPI003A0FD2C1
MKHILIDFENVQPEAEQLNGLDESCHIWLFLGKLQQKTLSVELCEVLCRFGKNVHFVRVAKTGKNALDFYLAYYLGKITEQDNEALICILSRDGGFDVLVEHLEDVGHCKGIVRLAVLEDARKNEAELLEKDLEAERPSEKVGSEKKEEKEPHKENVFISNCARVILRDLINPTSHKPTVLTNFETRLKGLLKTELQPFAIKQRQEIIGLVVAKLKEKGFIRQIQGTFNLEYAVSSQEILDRFVTRLIASKAKTLESAKNVLCSQAQNLCLDMDDTLAADILAYCGREQILRIKNSKIEYAPFVVDEGDDRDVIVSKEEDIKIMQAVTAFFNKCAKNKPSTQKALSNSFKSALKLSDKQIEKLIQVLIDKKKFTVSDTGKVTYKK